MRIVDDTISPPQPSESTVGDLSEGRTPSLSILRQKCQESVEEFNDPMGRLLGSRVSIHLTRVCLVLGIPANWVSYGMLASGILGAVALLFGGVYSVIGFSLLVAYYFLDCVDGEVARFRGQTNIEMAAFDYLCHIVVKGLMFVCLGIGLAGELSQPYALYFCMAALLATMLQKSLGELPRLLFAGKLLDQGGHLDGQTIRRNLGIDDDPSPTPAQTKRAIPPAEIPFRSQLRFLAVNFDLANFLFLGAALIDLFLATRVEVGFGVVLNAKALLAVGYGIILPLNFMDHLLTFIRSGRLKRDVKAYWLSTQRIGKEFSDSSKKG